jgi:hypothetical protein
MMGFRLTFFVALVLVLAPVVVTARGESISPPSAGRMKVSTQHGSLRWFYRNLHPKGL